MAEAEATFELSTEDGASARGLLQGGQLIAWRPAGGEQALYLSPEAGLSPGTPVRGGVPVVFPQFSGFGPLAKHGFARTQPWVLRRMDTHGRRATARLRLLDQEETRRAWPYAFQLDLAVTIGGPRLGLELYAWNRGEVTFSFSAALHTYLAVTDARQASVTGLRGLPYRDFTAGGVTREGSDLGELRIQGEVDRLYTQSPDLVILREPGREVKIRKTGFTDLVVWNPGPVKGEAIPDLPQDGYLKFVCLEAAVVSVPVRLSPGETWQGSQVIVIPPVEE